MSLRKKIHEEVPTTDLVLRVPLTEEGTVRLRAMANRVGCPPGQLVQQGIDWVADLADQSPGQAFERLRESSPLCREVRPGREASSEGKSGSEKKGCPFAVALRPARVAGLKEAALTIATTARENPESPSLWQEGSPTRRDSASSSEPDSNWPARMERLVQEAARWAAESLHAADVRTGGPSSRQAGQLFQKPSGEERGGRRVSISITKEAKKKISKRARRQFGWDASKLARLAVRDVIENIEHQPAEALRYVREERDYFQPPNRGRKYHYSYQIAVDLETRQLLKYAPAVLQHARERGISNSKVSLEIDGRKLSQRRVLQAAGRRAVESEDIGFQPLRPGGQ